MKYIICDLDGTLYTAAEGEGWYDRNFLIDKEIKQTKELLKRFKDCGILFVTGRKEQYRADTSTRLLSSGFDVFNDNRYKLFMRRNSDSRGDEKIKEEIYQIKIKPHYDIILVLDDLAACCQMWKNQGLFCLQIWQQE